MNCRVFFIPVGQNGLRLRKGFSKRYEFCGRGELHPCYLTAPPFPPNTLKVEKLRNGGYNCPHLYSQVRGQVDNCGMLMRPLRSGRDNIHDNQTTAQITAIPSALCACNLASIACDG